MSTVECERRAFFDELHADTVRRQEIVEVLRHAIVCSLAIPGRYLLTPRGTCRPAPAGLSALTREADE